MNAIQQLKTNLEAHRQDLIEAVKTPELNLSFREYAQRSLDSLYQEQEPTTTPESSATIETLKMGAMYGNILAMSCKLELLKLSEQGLEEATKSMRDLMGTMAIYPGTFDPFTKGHADVVRRSAQLFEHVIVAIGINPRKTPLFTVEERARFIHQDLEDLKPKVSVISFEGSLVNLARQTKSNVVLRGIRSVTEYENELQLALLNLKLSDSHLETLFIPAQEGASFVSSSIVKEVVKVNEDASSMVSPQVLKALKDKREIGAL
jgi:pantetheine-phosphate adenylyltransferase